MFYTLKVEKNLYVIERSLLGLSKSEYVISVEIDKFNKDRASYFGKLKVLKSKTKYKLQESKRNNKQ